MVALETHLFSEPLREACKEVFDTVTNIYAEKLIESGLAKEIAQELGAFILMMIEGAITVSVTQKNLSYLLAASNQIGMLLSHYFD